MDILFGIAMYFIGLVTGTVIVYKHEKKILDRLIKDCNDCHEKMSAMIKEESAFIENMWPKQYSNITNVNSVADYLKKKYLDNEPQDWSDCEDESDNLYI